ncbi:12379_t:CDS:1, partial [Racocetra fulgida]
IVTNNNESDLKVDYKEDNNTKLNEKIVIDNDKLDLERDYEEDNEFTYLLAINQIFEF